MKQLFNLVFWCLTLCTLAISQTTSLNCGSNGHPLTWPLGSGGNVFACACECPYRPSKNPTTALPLNPSCISYIGSDCSVRDDNMQCSY
jgi:hypothetical protein